MFLQPDIFHIYSDAAKTLGYGAYLNKSWFSVKWPSDHWKQENITLLELVPIVVALHTWGKSLSNGVLKFFTDNEALHFVINKQSSKEEPVKEWIRKLVSLTLKYNILIKAFFIEGLNNYLADHLSRLEVPLFLAKFKSADKTPTSTINTDVLHNQSIKF